MNIDSFDEHKLNRLIINAKDFCLTNGLVMFTTMNQDPKKNANVFHSPITLFPSKFPEKEFNYAKNLQNHFNKLIYDAANDYAFLKSTLNDIVKKDDFTRHLFKIYDTVYHEGLAQPVSLCIMRNDYILDQNKFNANSKTILSQIEYNTMSCASGAATSKMTKLHKYMLRLVDSNDPAVKQAPNSNLETIAEGIVEAWRLYGSSKSKIGFVVRENEQNIGDQRILEMMCYELDPNVNIVRIHLDDVVKNGELDQDKRLFINKEEFGLMYFRSCYDPIDFPTEEHWNARLLIERSKAIKCPTINYHLAGTKRVQQELGEPGVLSKYVSDPDIEANIRAIFVEQYSFKPENIESLLKTIEERGDEFVLKPQREGGGNKFFGAEIKTFLETHDKSDLYEYVLMRLVKGVENENHILRAGCGLIKDSLISEMGVFGVLIGNKNSVVLNETGGYLLRSKFAKAKEGGVGIGTAALDSIVLV